VFACKASGIFIFDVVPEKTVIYCSAGGRMRIEVLRLKKEAWAEAQHQVK